MDITTLALAKRYTDSQRLAHTETKTITWDRNIDGMEVVMLEENAENNVYYRAVKVSDDPVELTKDSVRHLEIFSVQFEGEEYECSESLSVNLDEAIFASGKGMNYLILDQFGGNPAVIVAPQDITGTDDEGNEIVFITKGLWFADFYANSTTYCITSMTVDEIHRIESKYLPIGGGLPVVTITTAPDRIGDEFVLTEEESKQLDTAAATNSPCIINCAMADDGTQTTIANFVNAYGNGYMYWATLMPQVDGDGDVYQPYLVFFKDHTVDHWVMALGSMSHRAP